MNAVHATMQRPRRWSEPFDPEMDDRSATRIAAAVPLVNMDASRFPKSVPLQGIIRNDCRLLDLRKGDIIVREGDYGSSAFLIVSGEAIVSLKSLPGELLGRSSNKRKNPLQAFAQWVRNDIVAEARDYNSPGRPELRRRDDGMQTRVFLHDIPRVVSPELSESMFAGEIFGEISALTRTPRSATVIAGSDMVVVEIRWQGLRDLMKHDARLREHVEQLYRENSLRSHLREIELLSGLSPEQIGEIADRTRFETYGRFQWNIDYRSTRQRDISQRIQDEPLIAAQGDYVNGLLLVRNGFVRICRQHGSGVQTVSYMGKGGMFGLREIAANWKHGQQRPWGLSLRAVGYVDILRIPVETVNQHVLPFVDPSLLPDGLTADESETHDRRRRQREPQLDRGLLEFLVEERFTNGEKAMMIDLNRCTRCDDCVRACASTHNNNPRFIRQGQVHENWMITNACMHCTDPVCMIGCPTGAIGRDFATGNVTINDSTCIGCSTCANSCPYDNIRMVEINDRRGRPIVDQDSGEPIVKATKCDFCADQPGGPACQRACPHDALIRIDLTAPEAVTDWTRP